MKIWKTYLLLGQTIGALVGMGLMFANYSEQNGLYGFGGLLVAQLFFTLFYRYVDRTLSSW